MIALLIGTSWLLVVSLVLGLCAAARDRDLQELGAPVQPHLSIVQGEHAEDSDTQ
jgi:hypothetical protein